MLLNKSFAFFFASSLAISPLAFAANIDGTHVETLRTANNVTVDQPGCQGTVSGNEELKAALTEAGTSMAVTGIPYVAGAGGALAIFGRVWPSWSGQNFANCAVSCALINESAHVLKVEAHFKGVGTLSNSADEATEHGAGVGIENVDDGGMWGIGTGWYGVRRIPLMTSEVKGYHAQCIEFRNWSNTEDRVDIHTVVITDE